LAEEYEKQTEEATSFETNDGSKPFSSPPSPQTQQKKGKHECKAITSNE
jgi:hypothetical protein